MVVSSQEMTENELLEQAAEQKAEMIKGEPTRALEDTLSHNSGLLDMGAPVKLHVGFNSPGSEYAD